MVSPIVAFASGISGIVGQSTDAKGHLTFYGWSAMTALIISSAVAMATSIIEQKKEKEKEKNDLAIVNQTLEAQNKILDGLTRAFYNIETIDFSIEYFIPADHHMFTMYKVKLDAFIQRWFAENCPELEEGLTIIKAGNEPNNGHPVYNMSIRPETSLAPLEGIGNWENTLVHVKSDILIGRNTDFSYLNHSDLNPPIPSLYLNHGCDLRILAHAFFAKNIDGSPSCVLSYQPGKNRFRFISRRRNAVITFNNGKVLSYKDVIGKQLTIFIDSWFTQVINGITLGNVRVHFHRSQATDYSSYIDLEGENMTEIKGSNWKAYTYVVKPTM